MKKKISKYKDTKTETNKNETDKKRNNFKKEIASGSYRTTSSGPIYVKLEFGGKRGERRRKKFEEIISSLFSKLDENYKPTDPRNAINCKHKENKENYTNTHQLPQIS